MKRCKAKTASGTRCTRTGDRKGYCWQHEAITKSQLKKRGWTDAGIRDFLGDPDRTATNPHYRSGPEMKLYHLRRVESVESTDEWKAWHGKSKKRQKRARESAQKGVESKRQKALEDVRNWDPEIPKIGASKLTSLAVDSYNNRKMESGDYRTGASKNANPEFLQRIKVNYLRHRATNYEQRLKMLEGQVGKDEAYVLTKTRVLEAIAEVYPRLEAECRRQIKRAKNHRPRSQV